MARSFPESVLVEIRALPLTNALERLGYHVARDRDFVPTKDARSERWLVSRDASVTELVVTGPKWFDGRVGKGGGGPIDLVMHLEGLSFVIAVKRLASATGLKT